MRVLESGSREEWFEQRRGRVTASKIARLYDGGRAVWDDIRAEDRGEKPSFRGNEFTRWGTARESLIADFARFFIDSRLVHNEKLILADENDLFAATPDMIGMNHDGSVIIGEIKTVGSHQPWSYTARSVEDIPRRYQVQVAWQMMVTRAEECVFVWERRAGEKGDFRPEGEPQFIIIRPDLRLEDQLREVANRFLKGDNPSDESRRIAGLVGAFVRAQEAQERAAAEVAQIKAEIQDVLGDEDYSWSDDTASLSWRMPKPRRMLDQKALKAAHPDIVRNFMVEKPASGRVLRVTKKKGGQ